MICGMRRTRAWRRVASPLTILLVSSIALLFVWHAGNVFVSQVSLISPVSGVSANGRILSLYTFTHIIAHMFDRKRLKKNGNLKVR